MGDETASAPDRSTAAQLARGDVTTCDYQECTERIQKRPRGQADDYFEVTGPEDVSHLGASIYCSPECVARAMGARPGVDYVAVSLADESTDAAEEGA